MLNAEKPPRICLTQEGSVALIVIENPPVNSSTDLVRRGLIQALEAIDTNNASAVLLTGAGANLMAGADLNELEHEPTTPSLPEVTKAFEAFDLPVIALANGFTLGGGLELCLACDYRLAGPASTLGLPEVSVGVIPGSGGTQRLPRLIGMSAAVDMIVSGKPVKASKALDLGLVDEVLESQSSDDLVAEAMDIARHYSKGKRPLSKSPVPPFDREALNRQANRLVRKARGLPSAEAALEATLAAADLTFEEGTLRERATFLELRRSLESKAMRYLFFAERKPGIQAETAPERDIRRLAIIGAGTMGSGIALCGLNAGFEVTLIDLNPKALEVGVAKVTETLETDFDNQRINDRQKQRALDMLSYSTELESVKNADLVIEAIVEDLQAKNQLFDQLSRLVDRQTLLATNTSYLDLEKVFKGIDHPGRTLGLHFFSPAHRMKLLEVVHWGSTSQESLAAASVFTKRMKKQAIVVGNSWGFVGNRLYAAYRRQCEFMLEEGASYDQIDRALEQYGFAMGPFKVADMSGLDIAWRMRQQTADTRHLRRYVGIPDRLCEANRFGRKTGKGYYLYDGNGGPQVDPAVHALIQNYRAEEGIKPKTFTDEDIQRRATLSLINESLLLLEEGICQHPSDIDLALVHGYGFPRWKGGPVFLASDMDPETLKAELAYLASVSGKGHQAATPDRPAST